ncbi:unnamed protein product [Spirodela intermedia]|uniref:Plant heme peroxidase family profile domain-containing protein n=1 Tax=Spirodela intermedia TaxID=51605 RepID=A0A7I8IAY5_SPIIN|nr:unnamed protein product [Spirodela intermedia]CAA6654202.1 unnamed protein product [Spirodela intermedia]
MAEKESYPLMNAGRWPQAEKIIRDVVWKNVAANSALPPKLVRMFFHDCFVRGCDASVLLNTTTNSTAEKDAGPNRTLQGFDVVEQAKAAVEAVCPGIVSCADVLAMINRSAWKVQTGRRDGLVSRLTLKDLVVLSGAHTIGVRHCSIINRRLYNFTGKGDTDPALNATYAAVLKSQCPPGDAVATVGMDPGSSVSFDNQYYQALKQGKGFFQSSKIVGKLLLGSSDFLTEFGQSMKKMGAIEALTGAAGEIRRTCAVVNS